MLMSSTAFLKGSDVPTKVGLTVAWEKFWPDALPVATNDSCGYRRELNPDSFTLATEHGCTLHLVWKL